MMLRAEIYVISGENDKRLYGTCEKQINPHSMVSGICAFVKQCERFVAALNFAALMDLLDGRNR